jgi:hypothetical protein
MPEFMTQRGATAPRRSRRNALATGCLLVGVAVAAGFLCRAVPPATRGGTAAPARAPGPKTSRIEDLRVGDRVAAHNPEVDAGARRASDPDPGTWRRLKLRVDRPGECRFDIELLRPLAWLRAQRAEVGEAVRLRLPEMGLDDPARVLAIEPCPASRPGPGRVVTGTFAHVTEGNLVDVAVDGLDRPIGATTAHPFWSEDRQTFVFAAELRAGERLQTERAGVRRVTGVTPRPGREMVYNLEVDCEHAYYVSAIGVLVHNSSPNPPNPPDPSLSPRVRNGRAVLQHGTTQARAQSIVRNGPDPNFVEPGGGPPAGGFSTAPPQGPYPGGSPSQYAAGKAALFPNEGGPAVVEVEVPAYILQQAVRQQGEVRFEPGRGLEALMRAWGSLTKTIY